MLLAHPTQHERSGPSCYVPLSLGDPGQSAEFWPLDGASTSNSVWEIWTATGRLAARWRWYILLCLKGPQSLKNTGNLYDLVMELVHYFYMF